MTSLQLVQRWYAERDRALWAPDAVWELPASFPHGGTYSGHAQIFEGFFPRLLADWADWKAHPREVYDAGEWVVGTGHYSGTHKGTGRGFEARFVHLFQARDGLLARHRSHVEAGPLAQAVAA